MELIDSLTVEDAEEGGEEQEEGDAPVVAQ